MLLSDGQIETCFGPFHIKDSHTAHPAIERVWVERAAVALCRTHTDDLGVIGVVIFIRCPFIMGYEIERETKTWELILGKHLAEVKIVSQFQAFNSSS